jgi:hypothetical protein
MTVAFTGRGGTDASGLRTILSFVIPAQIALIAGLALTTVHFYEAGDKGLALAGLALAVFSSAIAMVEGTFHASVTVWFSRAAASTEASAYLYEPLRRWMNRELQLTYVSAFLSAMLMFSISTLRPGAFASWARWITMAWSLVAFPVYFQVLEAPAIIYVSPLLLAIGLLFNRPASSQA